MRTMLLTVAAGAALSLASLGPAGAIVANQSHVIAARATVGNVIEVRRHHRPRGWSRGKAWWKRGGHGVPPGHRR